jgi:hypothetical protein
MSTPTLSTTQSDAFAFLSDTFKQYGLEVLIPEILSYIQQGYGNDTVTLHLQQTDAYKQRFKANDARVKAGLPVLSPADYVKTEDSIRQVMQAAGLPEGFYDSQDDFTQFLANDVSPQEVQQRVTLASNAVYNADPATKDALQQWYGVDDAHLAAHFLDPEKAAPLLDKQATAAKIGGMGVNRGLGIDQSTAEAIGATGVSDYQLKSGLDAVTQNARPYQTLGEIYGVQTSGNDLLAGEFGLAGAQEALAKKRSLSSQERAAFNGSSAVAKGSLSQSTRGAT